MTTTMTTFAYDRRMTISTAGTRKATIWKPEETRWSELVKRLSETRRGTETLAEYLRLPKARQDELKDVGGYVAGTLEGMRRKRALAREIITLDFDAIPAMGTDDLLKVLDALGCAYCAYSTRKHEPYRPRLRVLLPLDAPVGPEEYEAIARRAAQWIGIDKCDPTTFQPQRLMYWPSASRDSQYVFAYADRPFLDGGAVLRQYENWRDRSAWPRVPGEPEGMQRALNRQMTQADPTTKTGIVGAFCRCYDVYAAMDKFLPGEYAPADDSGARYTYTGGSTEGGAVIYGGGKWIYSHHATDPAGGVLCHAFDLVRLHRFGMLDDESKPDVPSNRLPSWSAMCQLALADSRVMQALDHERYEQATSDFTAATLEAGGVIVEDVPDAENTDWMRALTRDANGTPERTIANIMTILRNDPALQGKIGYDEFAGRGVALGPLPWNRLDGRRDWQDADDAGLRAYLERTQRIVARDKIADALTLAARENAFNDVQKYLDGLPEWDEIPRLDRLLCTYLGAEDDAYVRAVTRKTFTAAVARAYEPGIKFDWMLILVGGQGIGKSTLLRLMGREWFSDSLTDFKGKEAAEMIQGIWINELSELDALNRSESETAKAFISRCHDIYREPFGRRTTRFPRRGIFIGTTNSQEFLRDATGERRYWPVTLQKQPPVLNVFGDLEGEVDLIWAEALYAYRHGEPLYLTPEEEAMARQQQEVYTVHDAREGLVREFLLKPVPLDWDARSIPDRRTYWAMQSSTGEAAGLRPRDRVCALEILCECFGMDPGRVQQRDTRAINAILDRCEGWERNPSRDARYGAYGRQRGFSKRL